MAERERGARYSDLFATDHQHREDNCAYCPICATIGLLRNTKPEVLDHLAAAARELIAAAGILVEEAAEVVAATENARKVKDEPRADGKNNVRHIKVP
jgi:hypothetical protein